MTEHELQHLNTFMGLPWQPEFSDDAFRCPHDLIRNGKGDNKRPKVEIAAGTPCLAQAGWRHSTRAIFQAVKRNISIYLPTNYKISFKHHLVLFSGPPRALAEISLLFPLLMIQLIPQEHLLTSLGLSSAMVGLAFSRVFLLPQKHMHFSA